MFKWISLFVVLFALCCSATAGSIDVSYTYSGSQGAWNLNFTVTNNLIAWPAQEVYLFGVALSAPGVTGSPAGYDPTVYGVYFTFYDGGQPLLHNNIWYDLTFDHLFPGTSLAGFRAQIGDIDPPGTVPWFAYTYTTTLDPSDVYTGSDAFFSDPDLGIAGFEGVASGELAPAPEPSTWALLALGIVSCLLLRRRAAFLHARR